MHGREIDAAIAGYFAELGGVGMLPPACFDEGRARAQELRSAALRESFARLRSMLARVYHRVF